MTLPSCAPFSFVGPSLAEGALPALFYFALSAEESLHTDPFNQPVKALATLPLRIFSLDLPWHGKDLPATEALKGWAEELEKKNTFFDTFLYQVVQGIEDLRSNRILIPEKTALCGLSRGAFVATHVAAHIPWIPFLLGFAPLTKLSQAKEFHHTKHTSTIESLNLIHLLERLAEKTVRFYIGNHDTRVGTAECFHFIHALTEAAYAKKIRSPQIELFLKPSIGHQGHGTSPEVFQEGALWLASKLGLL